MLRAIARARSAGATVDILEDWPDLCRLNRLAEAIEHPPFEARLTHLLAPIQLDERTALRRLTFAAEEWLIEHAEWFDERDVFPLAFAMAHPPERLFRWPTRREARRDVRAWAQSLRCPVAALQEAVEELLPKSRKDEAAPTQKEEERGLGPILGLLCREYRNDPDYWMFEAPAELAQALFDSEFRPRAIAENREARSIGGKVKAPDPRSHEARATWAFLKAQKGWLERKALQVAEGSANTAKGTEHQADKDHLPGSQQKHDEKGSVHGESKSILPKTLQGKDNPIQPLGDSGKPYPGDHGKQPDPNQNTCLAKPREHRHPEQQRGDNKEHAFEKDFKRKHGGSLALDAAEST